MPEYKTKHSLYTHRSYKPGGRFWQRRLWPLARWAIFNSPFGHMPVKRFLLRFFGASVGNGLVMGTHVNIKYPWNLVIGKDVWIGERTWFDSLSKIRLGDNVCISQGAYLLNGNHNYASESFDLIVKDITLEEGVWIGAGCIVCPGITAHSHAVLSVGSVATSNLDAYSVYQGNPARKIRSRTIQPSVQSLP
ncbi:MAG: WcaF family extracellular polysaccharide biosynthesis acetyltransferase [Bacteroidota bacterium]